MTEIPSDRRKRERAERKKARGKRSYNRTNRKLKGERMVGLRVKGAENWAALLARGRKVDVDG